MKSWRKIASVLLIVVGALMFVRGAHHAVTNDLGWQGLIASSVLSGLVIALGVARWRYWRHWQGR